MNADATWGFKLSFYVLLQGLVTGRSLLLYENSLVAFAHDRGAASRPTKAGILSVLCTLRHQTM